MELKVKGGKDFAEEPERVQWQYDGTLGGRYNVYCKEVTDNQKANYLNGNCRGGGRSMIARFRCGNEQWRNRYVLERRKRYSLQIM